MEFRIFILSLACLCCLTPPAFGSVHLLKAAAAVGAAKGAALLGAGALAVKGAAIKGAIKGAVAKGAAILAAKKLAVKGALALAAKAASVAVSKLPVVRPPPVAVHPAEIRYTLPIVPENTVAIETLPSLPPVTNSLTSLWSLAQGAMEHKINGVSNVMGALHPPRVFAAPIVPAPVLYEYPEPTRFFPLLQRVEEDSL